MAAIAETLPQADPPRVGLNVVKAVVLLSCFSFNLSLSVLTITLPEIAAEFNVTESIAAWVTVAPMLTSAVCTPGFGRLSDEHGPRPFWLAGVVLVLLGTFFCAIAPSLTGRLAPRISGVVCRD
jgi:MFS family permease